MSAVLKEVIRPAFKIVRPDEIGEVWTFLEPWIARALETSNGEATPEATREGLENGRTSLMFFESNKGFVGIVFMFLNFPCFKIARILLAFGSDMSAMKKDFEIAEAWAKDQGCAYVEAWIATESRKRLFSRFGYEPAYTIIRKKLT